MKLQKNLSKEQTAYWQARGCYDAPSIWRVIEAALPDYPAANPVGNKAELSYEIDGVPYPVGEAAKKLGVSKAAIYRRLANQKS